MLRYREQVTESAGFYNTVGFNDDTRAAFLSIPARHDLARRIDCRFLAKLVAEHRLDLEEAHAGTGTDLRLGASRVQARCPSSNSPLPQAGGRVNVGLSVECRPLR
jgi:hypothetical protein